MRKESFVQESNWSTTPSLLLTKKNMWPKGHIELKGKTITISVLSENIYKAVDELVEKLDRGLRRRSRLAELKGNRQAYMTSIGSLNNFKSIDLKA